MIHEFFNLVSYLLFKLNVSCIDLGCQLFKKKTPSISSEMCGWLGKLDIGTRQYVPVFGISLIDFVKIDRLGGLRGQRCPGEELNTFP